MRRLAQLRVETGHRHRLSPGGRKAEDRPARTREEDVAGGAPRAAEAVHVVQHDGRAARGLDPLQFLVGEKSDGASVRRPEGQDAGLGSGERRRRVGVERTHPDLDLAPFVDAAEGDAAAVGRDHGVVQADLFGKQDVGAQNFCRGSRHRPGARERQPCGNGHRDARHRPRDPLPVPSPRRDRGGRGDAGGRTLGDPLELLADVSRRLPAVLGVLGQAGAHDPVERGRRHRGDLRDLRRLVAQDRRDERRLRRAGEGLPARRHLEENGAQSEDVRPRVRVPALQLLGRHVLKRPEDRALARQLGLRGQRGEGAVRAGRRHRFRQPEVEQLHAGLRQHDVAGLQVAVNDPLAVRLVERVGDLRAVAQHLLGRQRPLGQARGERLAFEKLHDQVVDLALAADVVQSADVRVGQRRDRLRLALEAFAQLRVVRERRRQDLDRDRAPEARVPRLVDLSHPPGADGRLDLVGAETGSRCNAQGWREPIPGQALPLPLLLDCAASWTRGSATRRWVCRSVPSGSEGARRSSSSRWPIRTRPTSSGRPGSASSSPGRAPRWCA